MPFDPSHPPAKLKKLSPKKQRQWIKVFNSVFSRTHDDKASHMAAWGAVGKSDAVDQLGGFSDFVIWKTFENGGVDEKERIKNQ